MGAVVLDMSMSLDGFVTGPAPRAGLPLGEGGERLHDWMFSGQPQRLNGVPGETTSMTSRVSAAVGLAFHFPRGSSTHRQTIPSGA